MKSAQDSIGNVSLTVLPAVVGTVIDPQFFTARHDQLKALPADLVEIRLDHWLPLPNWKSAILNLKEAGKSCFVTVRAQFEGGKWAEPEESRLNLIREAIEVADGVDIELKSRIAKEVAHAAQGAGKACIVSYHDFEKTPPRKELLALMKQSAELGSVVKISCMAREQADIHLLESLLEEKPGKPLCIIAMGPAATITRVSFAVKGSKLTYGFLDTPAAPGQLSARELVEKISELLPGYKTRRDGGNNGEIR